MNAHFGFILPLQKFKGEKNYPFVSMKFPSLFQINNLASPIFPSTSILPVGEFSGLDNLVDTHFCIK